MEMVSQEDGGPSLHAEEFPEKGRICRLLLGVMRRAV
jgi:hypothetical protein